jgi:Ca2+-binding RTX toxin-like protein
MHRKPWLWTFRSLILLLCCTVGIGLLQASDADDTETVGAAAAPAAERTYLYYFESSEAKLDSTTPTALFAFGTLPKENVTLVAYGLDDVILPQMTLTDSEGNHVADALPTGNAHVVVYRFEASENRLYNVDVSRKNTDSDATGLVRVMVFEGDPITVDRTLLDNVNPLLPGRSFMVGGKEPTEDQPGLSMVVEALPIGRFNRERPEIFASRGSDEFMPPLPERIDADDLFQWYNVETPEIQFYTVTIRATPETLDGMEQLKFRQLNANSFFYYDYYLIIGAGSDPVSVVRGDDCQNQPNRIECIGRGDDSGRTAPAPQVAVPVEAEAVFEEASPVTVIDVLPEAPPITIGLCDAVTGVNTAGDIVGGGGDDDLGGTTCKDTIIGNAGNDNVAGGPSDDKIDGGDGNDILRGDEGSDTILGGTGDDKIDGGADYDFIHPGTGNDNIGYLADINYDLVSYDDLAAGVTVNLNSNNNPTGSRNCQTVVGPGGAYTGYVLKAGNQVDCLRGQFDVVTTNFDDIVTNNTTQINYIDTLDGEDTVNIIGGGAEVYMGDGDDTVNLSGNIVSGATLYDGYSNQQPYDARGPISFDFNDNETYNFANGVTGDIYIADAGGTDLIDLSAIVGSDSIIDLRSNGFGTANISVGGLNVDLETPYGASIIENVNATNQNDVIATNAADNIINAYTGDDIIYGSCGVDTLNAGGGTDLLSYELMTTGVTVSLATNTATDKGGCGTDTLSGFENLDGSNYNDILGGDGNINIINGLDGEDTVNAGGGADTVTGGAGNDILNGDAGDDILSGDAGDDTLNGGAGLDTITGGIGNDTANGGDDNDIIDGGVGDDILSGDAGEDVIDGGVGTDTLNGGDDDDTLTGDVGTDTLNGDAGDDILDGGDDADTLNGGDDDDTLTGGAGFDTINGDAGDDTIIVTDADAINGGADVDTMDASTYAGPIVIDLLGGAYTGGGTVLGVENVIGTDFDDVIRGDASVNNIQSGAGNDYIIASAGNDVINGGAQTVSTAANPGDTVSYTAFNTIMTTTINGTNAVVNVGGFTQTLTNIENLYGTNTVGGIDQVIITNGMAGAGVPLDTDPGFRITTTATSAAYTFAATATGRVIVDNSVEDTFTFGTLNGFNPYILNTYQDLGGGLYLMITRGLNTYCPTTPPGLTITVDANTTSTHTQCITNETFNGQGGVSSEGVSYVARPDNLDLTVTIGGNVWTVDDGAATVIGTDTLNNIERLLLNNGDHTIFVNALPTNASTVDLGTLAGTHTLDLTGYGANSVVNLNGGVASFGGQITFLDDITNFIGSAFNDDVTGNALNNTITTNGGDDTVNAGGGIDTITTGAGNDTVNGDDGNDIIDSGDGNDIVTGGEGDDTITPGTGVDNADGGNGDDLFVVITDGANDSYGGSFGNDTLTYDPTSTALNVSIVGGGGDFATEVGGFIDKWSGFEVVSTGDAADTFTLSNPVGYTTINSMGGNDTINVNLIGGAIPVPVFNAGDGGDTFNIVNTGADNAVANLLGQAGNDVYNITWDAYNNIFDGDADADSVVYQDATPLTLILQVGNDTVTDAGVTLTDTFTNMESITLGGGVDSVTVNDATGYTYAGGGDGDDTFDVNAANAITVLDGGTGTDTADIIDLGAVTLTINGAAQTVGVQQLENFEIFNTSDLNDTFNVTTDNIAHTVDSNLGTDTVNLTSSSGLGVTIDVSIFSTTVTDKSGALATDTFHDVENFNATNQDDTLNFQPFVIFGSEFIDTNSNTYNGMNGTDTANYNVTMTDLTVNVLAGGNITVQNSANLAAWTDTFVNFEQVLSGAGNDTWNMAAGVTSNNTFNANAGVDTADYSTVVGNLNIVLNTTNTTLNQGAFTHTLYNFESILTGAGDDNWTVNNGSGTTSYTFNGNTGNDSVSYNDTTSNWSYTANLGAGGNTIFDNDAVAGDDDTLINIEGLTTDDADDFITIHDSTIVTVNTLGGDDTISVGDAGAGTDNVANTFNMGAGTSDDLWYLNSNNAVVINYTGTGAGTVQEGAKAIDTFTGVENLAATGGNDTFNITADGTTNIFYGMAGSDTVDYANGTAVAATINGFTTTVTGGGATDTLYTMETIIGSDQGDTFNIVTAAGSTVTSVQGDAGADIFNITNTGSAAFQMAGGAGADTYNFLAFDGFDNAIAEDGSANVINYSAVGALDLDVELNAANTTVDDNVNTDTFTGTFATIQTSSGADEVFVRRALTGTTVQTNAGNDIFHFENSGGTDFIGNGATLLDAGVGIDTADFATINGALTVGYTGCAANATVTSGAQTSTLANFESYIGGTATDTFNVAFSPCDVTFNGAGGADEINYATTAAGTPLTFTLDGTDTVTNGTNTHSIVSFAIVRGSDNADVFNVVNDALYTNLYGNAGADTFNVQSNTASTAYDGGAGQDKYVVDYVTVEDYTVTITGTTGTVNSGTFVDTLDSIEDVTTGGGNDTFVLLGDAIVNNYDAGAGTDTADYSGDVTGIAFVLDGGVSETVGNDTLTNFEAIIAGAGNDTFTVTGAGEIQYVSLDGNGGDDTFNMEWGGTNNIINGGAGNNSYAVAGVSAVDLTVTYPNATSSTIVGGGVTDTLNDISNIATSDGNDTYIITADLVDNTFNGGNGNDTADYSADATGLTFNLDGGAFETVDFGVGTDTLYDFESILAGTGNDIFNLGTSDYTVIDANAGDDAINVTDAAFAADVVIQGDLGTDTYTYTGTNPLTVALNNATSTITNSGNDHTLNGIEVVNLNTQAGDASTVTINDATEVTTVNTGDGNETVTVTDGGTITTLDTGAGADVVTVTNADSMAGIDTGTGADTVTLNQDTTNTIVDGGAEAAVIDTFISNTTGSATTVTQAGTNVSVAAGGNTDVFQNFENGTFNTGASDDIFTIDTDVAGTWTLNSGTGTNRYNFIGSGLGAVTVTVATGNTTASGLDTLDFSAMGAGITLNTGIATTQTVVGSFKLILATAIAKVEGSAFNDTITGTSSNDTINGNAGVDIVYGLAGDDTITGGDGTDTLYGGTGADNVSGGNDADKVYGGSLSDATCTAGADVGNDTVNGDAGADAVYGGNNNTAANAGSGCADSGNDTVNGGDDADTVYGGNQNDGGANGVDSGNDIVNGGAGNDDVYGGNNNCSAAAGTGGAGNDTGSDQVNGGAGNDDVYGGNNNSDLAASCGVNGAGGTGTDGNDTVTDTDGTDAVYGGNNNSGNNTGTAASKADGVDTVNTNDGDADLNYGDNNNTNGGTGSNGAGDTQDTNASDTGGTGSR